MTTGIVYDPIYLEHRIGTHVESHSRLIAIMDLLNEKKIFEDNNFKLIKPRKANLDQIKYVHEESLINEVKDVSKLAEKTGHIQSLDLDTDVSAKTYEASLYSVGGNLQGLDNILTQLDALIFKIGCLVWSARIIEGIQIAELGMEIISTTKKYIFKSSFLVSNCSDWSSIIFRCSTYW